MLETYERDGKFWVRGTIDEIPGYKYIRKSCGTSNEGHAQDFATRFKAEEIRRHFVGPEKAEQELTFADAVLLYSAQSEAARDLLKVLPLIGERPIASLSAKEIRALGLKLYPDNATDSWRRRIIVPVRAVINNAHDLGKCPPILIKGYSTQERINQDKARGKLSRQEKTPSDWEWISAFMASAPGNLAGLCRFMFETAARISQALELEPKDLDLSNRRVWMPAAKGTPAQWVDLSPELTGLLGALKPKRPRANNGNKPYSARVFGYAGKNSVYRPWKRVCAAAGIEVIMPHYAGRHGFATELVVRQGLDPETVRKGGRWADDATVRKIYVHSQNSSDLVQAALRTGRVQSQNKNAHKPL